MCPSPCGEPRPIRRIRPNPHASFGDGPHICLGAHFAWLQLRVLHEEVCRTLPPGRLELAGPPRRLVSNFINGAKSLPVQVGEV